MEDVKTVHYVSKDPISNLKVRVVLTRISALRRKPKYGDQFSGYATAGQQQEATANPFDAHAAQLYPPHPLDAAYHQYPYPPAEQGPNPGPNTAFPNPVLGPGGQASTSGVQSTLHAGPNPAGTGPTNNPSGTTQGHTATAGPNQLFQPVSSAAGVSTTLASGAPPTMASAAAGPGARAAVRPSADGRPDQRMSASGSGMQPPPRLTVPRHAAGQPVAEADEGAWGDDATLARWGVQQQQAGLHHNMQQQQPQQPGQYQTMMQQQQQQQSGNYQNMQQPQYPQQQQQQQQGAYQGLQQNQMDAYQAAPFQPPSQLQRDQANQRDQQPIQGYQLQANAPHAALSPLQYAMGTQQQQTQQQSGSEASSFAGFHKGPQQQQQQQQTSSSTASFPGFQQLQLQLPQYQQQPLQQQQQLQSGPAPAITHLLIEPPPEQQQQQRGLSADGSNQWQHHQAWQQQQPTHMQQQQLQWDAMTGQWVSLGPLLGGNAALGPDGMPLPPRAYPYPALGPDGLPIPSGAYPWGMMPALGPDGLPLPAGVYPPLGPDGMPLPGFGPGQQQQQQAPDAPEKLTLSSVFSWQEKVYSRSEVAGMQNEALQGLLQPGPDPWQQQQQDMPGDEVPGVRKATRHMALGSEHSLKNKNALDPRVQGSVMFTYVHSDEFCEREEISKTVTTSEAEQKNMLFMKLMGSAKSRQQVLNFRTMYIMADLADEVAPAYVNEKVLVGIKAYPDGSFDMRPGFSKPGCKYRFEDAAGGIYEYSVENASNTAEPNLERRKTKLQKAVVKRAEEIRRNAVRMEFQAPPVDSESFRLVLLGEIMAAADFDEDHLYVEYMLRFDPQHWELQTAWEQPEPGVLRGVTQTSRMVCYPEDPASDTPERWVAHFAQPIELELLSRGQVPANRYPSLMLQVCSYNRFNRYTCEGYGWLGLGGKAIPGSAVHYIRTWKPLSSMHDRLQEFFIGGSRELEEMSYLSTPQGADARVINKYGFKTESTGVVKVRLHSMVQQFNPDVVTLSGGRKSLSPARLGLPAAAAATGGGSPGAKANRRGDVSLDAVLARARVRLKEARGGDIGVRPGVVSEAPLIRMDPSPVSLPEGGLAHFNVTASGLEPLRYQWYKDDKKLTMATSDTASLIIAEVSAADQGQYYCQVSNKDGSVNSGKAMLKVERVSRLARAGNSSRQPPLSPSSGAGLGSPGSPAGGARAVRRSRLASTQVSQQGALGAAAGGQQQQQQQDQQQPLQVPQVPQGTTGGSGNSSQGVPDAASSGRKSVEPGARTAAAAGEAAARQLPAAGPGSDMEPEVEELETLTLAEGGTAAGRQPAAAAAGMQSSSRQAQQQPGTATATAAGAAPLPSGAASSSAGTAAAEVQRQPGAAAAAGQAAPGARGASSSGQTAGGQAQQAPPAAGAAQPRIIQRASRDDSDNDDPTVVTLRDGVRGSVSSTGAAARNRSRMRSSDGSGAGL